MASGKGKVLRLLSGLLLKRATIPSTPKGRRISAAGRSGGSSAVFRRREDPGAAAFGRDPNLHAHPVAAWNDAPCVDARGQARCALDGQRRRGRASNSSAPTVAGARARTGRDRGDETSVAVAAAFEAERQVRCTP